jgi:HK97 family phage major capsid protein
MNQIDTLKSEKDILVKRADELAGLSEYSAEQRQEIPQLRARLLEVKKQIVEHEEAAQAQIELRADLAETKKFDERVPKGNRPAHVYNVSQKGKPVAGITRKNYLPEVELSEDDVRVLKKDGFSDDTIQGCSTPAYLSEFTTFLKSGGRHTPEMVLKSMTEAGAGGVLVPIQWGELITNPPMNGMLRSSVRNMAVNTQLMRFPRIQTTNVNYPAYPVKVSWGGEQPTSTQNPNQGANFNTTNVDIQVNEVYAQGLFSISLLEDNAYSLQSYIPSVFQESLDVDLDAKIISGTGTTDSASPQPWGLNETGIIPQTVATTTGASAAVKFQDFVNVFYQLPQQYRAQSVWLMNSKTLGAVAGLVDGNQRPLFLPNFGYMGDTPGGGATWSNGTILGRPFVISENMPDVAQGNVSIYLADWQKLYFLLSRVGPTVKILDQPQYTAGNYIFALRSRMGGRVVQPWAGRSLKHN